MVIKNIIIGIFTALFFHSIQAWADATASIDRNSIQVGETVQLTISVNDTAFMAKPDISILENNFNILGQQKSSQTSYINGEKTALTEWRYELSPKNAGVFTIPAIDIDGEKTQPLNLRVSENNTGSSATSNEPVFIETSINKKNAYVQEEILLTLRINSAINMSNIQLENLSIDNAIIIQAGNTNYQRTINHTPYVTYEVVYAIYPQKSGTLQIPSLSTEAIASSPGSFNSFFNNGRTIRLTSQQLSLEVKTAPANAIAQDWLPAKDLHITETWSANPENIQVGDSITRTIAITAKGLSAQQLNTVSMPANEHYKLYPEQAQNNDSTSNEGITGTRQQSIAIVATKAGEFTLPAINIEWWNTDTEQLQTATLPAVTIKILDNSTTSLPNNSMAQSKHAEEKINNTRNTDISIPAASPATPSSKHTLWLWQVATFIGFVSSIIFCLLYIKERKTKKITNDLTEETVDIALSRTLQTLEIACREKNLPAIKKALLAWAKHYYPNRRITCLHDIGQTMQSEQLSHWLQSLDASLYNNMENEENWLDLYQFIDNTTKKSSKKKAAELPPLYPGN